MDFLTNLNTNLTAETLRNMLSALREKKKPNRKAEMAQRLNQIWIKEPRRLLDALSEPERALLAECTHGDDREPDVTRLNAKYGFSYSIPYHCSYRDCHFVLCFLARDDRRSHALVDGTAERLMTLLPPPPALTIHSEDKLPEKGQWIFLHWGDRETHETRTLQCYESECVAPVETRRMLQLAAAGRLRVSDKTGMPSEATRKTVGEALCAPELDLALPDGERRSWNGSDIDPGPVRALAWPVLLQQCGWAKPTSGKLALTRKGKRLLDDFTFAQYADGVRSFVSDSKFDEMRRIAVIKGQSGRRAGRGRIPASVRRGSMVDCLADLPRNEWVELEEAHRAVLAVGGEGRVVVDGMSLYIADPQYGPLGGKELALGRIYFRQLAGASLATLGVIDLGYAHPHYLAPDLRDSWGLDDEMYVTQFDGVKYLRVTALGRFCLGVDKTYNPPEQEQRALFRVLPNMDLVVTDAAGFSIADAAMLDRFAKKKSDSVWKLDGKTVLQALEAGDRSEDILTALQNGSGEEAPDTVRRLVEETAARAGAATAREDAVIVTFRDEETAALVAHDRAAGKMVLCRDGARVVVRVRNLKGFRSALNKLGILLP